MFLLSTTATALACGGLFCNNNDPVDQSGEQIVFEVDEEADRTTMHVNVAYEGPSESFAWVVPVQGIPDLFRSHRDLFTILDATTAPSYGPVNTYDDSCTDRWGGDGDADTDADADADADADSDVDIDGGGVEVLATEHIASYEITILAATDATDLTEWLIANEYDLPFTMDEALAPYVANGMNFAAIKLAKDTDTGNLPPLGMSYDGTTPVVPLQLTAVAAVPDMPITIYMVGEARGVPTNYLHVRLNPMAVDYFSLGANLDEVIGRAADEAGGQAFATLAAIENAGPPWVITWPGRYAPEQLHDQTHAADFVASLQSAGFVGTPEVLEVLRTYFPVPEGFPYSENDFYNAPDYYRGYYAAFEFDPIEVADALVEAEVAPRETAQELIDDMPWLTRLRSSVSPEEMTLDPQFGFNPDLEAVSPDQNLTIRAACDTQPGNRSANAAPQLLTWPSGQSLWVPSLDTMWSEGTTYQDYIDSDGVAALYIEQMSTQGPPEILVDNFPDDPTYGTAPDGPAVGGIQESEARGCGCNQTTAGGTLGLLAALAIFARRRR